MAAHSKYQVELLSKNINQTELTFFNKYVDFKDLSGSKEPWDLSYKQFFSFEKVFSAFKQEEKRLATRIEQFNKKALSKKPQKFEEFKSEVNSYPYRQCCILDSDLCAFFFVDLEQQGLAIARNWPKVSILPYKQWFDQKTEKKCVFPLGAKKVANAKMIDCTLKGMSTSSGLFAMVRLLGPIIDHSKSKKLILSFLEHVDQARIC